MSRIVIQPFKVIVILIDSKGSAQRWRKLQEILHCVQDDSAAIAQDNNVV